MTNTTSTPVRIESLRWRVIHWAFLAMFGLGAFVHAGLAIGNPDSYPAIRRRGTIRLGLRRLAEHLHGPSNPVALLLGAAELVIAVLLIRIRPLGYVAVVSFHLALMLFGWGFWLWCLPALAFAVPATLHTFRTLP